MKTSLRMLEGDRGPCYQKGSSDTSSLQSQAPAQGGEGSHSCQLGGNSLLVSRWAGGREAKAGT